MDTVEAETLAGELMDLHGLTPAGWLFKLDTAERRFGNCDYGQRTISLSRPMTEAAGPPAVAQALLHEIAHALIPHARADGTTIGHGPEWKTAAWRIGYSGGRTVADPRTPHHPLPTASPSLHPIVRRGDIVQTSTGIRGHVVGVRAGKYIIDDGAGGRWVAGKAALVKVDDR